MRAWEDRRVATVGRARYGSCVTAPQSLAFDDDGIRLMRGDVVEQEVRWADLVEVGVMTSDEGPFSEDLWLILVGSNGRGCAVPSEVAGYADLADRVLKLPGFDGEKYIAALGSTQNAKFVCWRREEGR